MKRTLENRLGYTYLSLMLSSKICRSLVALLLGIVAYAVISFAIALWRSPYSIAVLIASAYEGGLIGDENPGLAADWYLSAAKKGDRVAQYKLGFILYYGRGVDVDRAKGLRWIRESAEYGNADAQYFMGVASIAGVDVPADLSGAATWFRKAAEQGHAKAQRLLASLYHKGIGSRQAAMRPSNGLERLLPKVMPRRSRYWGLYISWAKEFLQTLNAPLNC